MKVKCLAQEHYTMSPARAQTWMAGSRNMRTNNEATVPPQPHRRQFLYLAGILWSFKIGEKADWSFHMLFYDLQALSCTKEMSDFMGSHAVSVLWFQLWQLGSLKVFKSLSRS